MIADKSEFWKTDSIMQQDAVNSNLIYYEYKIYDAWKILWTPSLWSLNPHLSKPRHFDAPNQIPNAMQNQIPMLCEEKNNDGKEKSNHLSLCDATLGQAAIDTSSDIGGD